MDERILDTIQGEAFSYFLHETNPANGMVLDKTREDWPASIAAIGLGLTAYPVGIERGLITRDAAIARVLATLRFFAHSQQGLEATATGYKGFYYHFLDMKTGQRAWRCELSTMDTALLIAGMQTAASYFDQDTREEREIRSLTTALYERVDWQWAQNGSATIALGWTPEHGFLPDRWEGYDEALILYALALGSPTRPIGPESYAARLSTYEWKRIYEYEFLYAGSFFIHQLSHVWIDFRGIQDAFMRDHGIDYHENSRRATYVQQQYAIHNPNEFVGYGKDQWGISASDGPGDTIRMVGGRKRTFFDYCSRGVPDGPDDGTLAPWSVGTAIPFAPEIVVPTLQHFSDIGLRGDHRYGFMAAMNATFPDGGSRGWVSPYHFGLNQGPLVIMIENYRSGLIWNLTRRIPSLVTGLRRAGFTNGWLA